MHHLVIEFMDGLPDGLEDMLRVAASLKKVKMDSHFYFVKVGMVINIEIIET